MNGAEHETLGEVARSVHRTEMTIETIRRDVKILTEAGVLRRLDTLEDSHKWIVRTLFGAFLAFVGSGVVAILYVVAAR